MRTSSSTSQFPFHAHVNFNTKKREKKSNHPTNLILISRSPILELYLQNTQPSRSQCGYDNNNNNNSNSNADRYRDIACGRYDMNAGGVLGVVPSRAPQMFTGSNRILRHPYVSV